MIKSENIGLATYVTITGVIDITTVTEISEFLFNIVEKTNKNIELDLSDVDYMDSLGLSVLINIHKKLNAKGKNLIIKKIDERLYNILKLSSLTAYFGL